MSTKGIYRVLAVVLALLWIFSQSSGCTSANSNRQTAEVSKTRVRAILGDYDYEAVIRPQRDHSLYVTKEGNFFDIGDGRLAQVGENSRFADDPQNAAAVRDQLDERIQRILKSIDNGPISDHQECDAQGCRTVRSKEVVLFVHGGLRTVKSGIGRTRVLQKAMLGDGVTPIFVNWRSGFFTTYWDHLWRVRQGNPTTGRRIQLPFTIVSDVLRTVADAPAAWASEAQHSFESWRVRKKFRVEALHDHNSENAYLSSVHFEGNDTVSHFKRDLLWWLTSPIKIITTPLVHTLGKPPWDIMRTRALSTANDRERFPQMELGELVPVAPSVCRQDGQQCAPRQTVSVFLQSLGEHLKKVPVEFDRYRITLVGHSMGVIVLNDALRNSPGFPADRIIHMASADSVLNTMATLSPYLADPRHAHTQYYALSLHPNNDDRETSIWGAAPSGSLLVWIDNMYTSPATTLERTAGRFENFADFMHRVPPSLIERFHFKVFGKSKDRPCDIELPLTICSPQIHGDFSEAKFWDPAFFWKG